ncbi:MAG: hypothetical protein V4622_02605 [Bacteroidota bacterium]
MTNSYFPLDLLQSFLELNSLNELISQKNELADLISVKYSEGKKLKIGNKLFEYTDILTFINKIEGEETIVFFQWIENSPKLKEILVSDEVSHLSNNDFLIKQYKEHFLLKPFKKFVSFFLLGKLMHFSENSSLEIQQTLSSYLCVLDADSALILQDKLNSNFKTAWKKIELELIEVKNEKELIRLVGSYFSEQKIQTLNNFNKDFYRSKVELIEQGTSLFQHKFASNRLVFWLINQLNLLELNSEHKDKLNEIRESVKNGENSYFKQKASLKTSWNIIRTSLFGLLAGGLIFLIYYILNFSDSTEIAEQSSSFKNFSKKERILLDSLIQSMEGKEKSNEPVFDQGNAYLHLSPVYIDIKKREPLKNEQVEAFVQDNLKAQNLVLSGETDSCEIYSENELKKLNFPAFESVNELKGDKKMYFKNESSYQVIILVFENKTNSIVYSHVLLSEEEIKFSAKENQHFLFIPGSNLGNIHFKNDASFSKDYKHHFCFTDDNYENYLLNSYKLKSTQSKTIKILFNENSAKEFYLVDIEEALESLN